MAAMNWISGSAFTRTARVFCVLLFAISLPAGCEKPPAATQPNGGKADGATTTAPEGLAATPVGRDAQDDPDAPRALPRSSEVQGWIKTEAARAAVAEKMVEFVEDTSIRRLLDGFKFTRLARAGYQSPHARAEVFLAEGLRPEDALGAFSLAVGGAACTPGEDGSLRAAQTIDGKLVLLAWQGTTLARVEGTLEREEGRRDCERLLARMLFALPMAEPPLLMQAVKEVPQEVCRFWIARSSGPLARQPNPRLRQIDPAGLDARLGLNGEALLSVVAVEQTRGAAPVVLWLAQYPTADEAKAAAERYAQALATEPRGLDAVTFVGSAKADYLIGTWTADQETARQMVKMLEEALPLPMVPGTRPS